MGTLYEVNSSTGNVSKVGTVKKNFLITPDAWHLHYYDVAPSYNGAAPGTIYEFPSGGYNQINVNFVVPSDYSSGLRIRVWGMRNTGGNVVYLQLGAMRTSEGGFWTTISGDDISTTYSWNKADGYLRTSSWWEIASSFVTAPAAYDFIGLSLRRDDNNVNDTYSGTWWFVGVEVEYQSSKLGEAV